MREMVMVVVDLVDPKVLFSWASGKLLEIIVHGQHLCQVGRDDIRGSDE